MSAEVHAAPDPAGDAARPAASWTRSCRRRRRTGEPFVEMHSGAAHDTMCVAERVPSAMVFVPCVEGDQPSPGRGRRPGRRRARRRRSSSSAIRRLTCTVGSARGSAARRAPRYGEHHEAATPASCANARPTSGAEDEHRERAGGVDGPTARGGARPRSARRSPERGCEGFPADEARRCRHPPVRGRVTPMVRAKRPGAPGRALTAMARRARQRAQQPAAERPRGPQGERRGSEGAGLRRRQAAPRAGSRPSRDHTLIPNDAASASRDLPPAAGATSAPSGYHPPVGADRRHPPGRRQHDCRAAATTMALAYGAARCPAAAARPRAATPPPPL